MACGLFKEHYLFNYIRGKRDGILYLTYQAHVNAPRSFLDACKAQNITVRRVSRSDNRRNTFVFQQDSECDKS